MAFNLLYLVFGEAYAKIPAFTEATVDVWAQAAENNQREGLDAIEKARQFSVLLMDLLSADVQFMTFDEAAPAGACDRAYYAQVADGNAYRVPRLGGERIANAMGVRNPVQLRQYRALLRLPDPVWEAANDLGWSEKMLREMMSRAVNDQHLTEMARIEAAKSGYTVTGVTVWEDNPHPLTPSPLHGEGEEAPPQSSPQAGKGQVLGEPTGEGLPEEVWAQYGLEPHPPAPSPSDGEGGKTLTPFETDRFLRWAHGWGRDLRHPGGWFDTFAAALPAVMLNPLVDMGLLEQYPDEVEQYRIAPGGCRRIKQSVITWDGDRNVGLEKPVAQPGASGRPIPKSRPRPLLSGQEAQLFNSLAALTDSGVRDFDAEEREKAMQLVSRCMDVLERVGREIAGGGEEY